MKTIKLTQILGVLAIIVLVLVVGYYVYTDMISISNNNKEIKENTKVELPGGVIIEGEGNYTVEIVPTEEEINISVPDLDRLIISSKDLPVEARDILKANIDKISAELKKDSSFFENWIELGIQRKIAGDYAGAVEAWDYAVALRPLSSVPYHNLGNLYAYFLKDNVLAEQNFLKAIKNAQNDIYLYFKIAGFYRDVLGDTEKARQIVQQGIDANPSSSELKELLDSL